MFPLRFSLLLSIALIRIGSYDVSGFYVIPYGFDNPYGDDSYHKVPVVVVTTTEEPITTTEVPTTTTDEPSTTTEVPTTTVEVVTTTTEVPTTMTPVPTTTPTTGVTATPQPPTITTTMSSPTTTLQPPVTTTPPSTEAPTTSTPTTPIQVNCVCDCDSVRKDRPYTVKYLRQYNYYYPKGERVPIPLPLLPPCHTDPIDCERMCQQQGIPNMPVLPALPNNIFPDPRLPIMTALQPPFVLPTYRYRPNNGRLIFGQSVPLRNPETGQIEFLDPPQIPAPESEPEPELEPEPVLESDPKQEPEPEPFLFPPIEPSQTDEPIGPPEIAVDPVPNPLISLPPRFFMRPRYGHGGLMFPPSNSFQNPDTEFFSPTPGPAPPPFPPATEMIVNQQENTMPDQLPTSNIFPGGFQYISTSSPYGFGNIIFGQNSPQQFPPTGEIQFPGVVPPPQINEPAIPSALPSAIPSEIPRNGFFSDIVAAFPFLNFGSNSRPVVGNGPNQYLVSPQTSFPMEGFGAVSNLNRYGFNSNYSPAGNQVFNDPIIFQQ